MLRKLAQNLFSPDTKETAGDIIVFRVLELFLVALTVKFCWEWGIYTQKLSTVMLPLGIANYVDVSFMFDNGISVLTAAVVTVLCALGFFRVGPTYLYLLALTLFHLQYVARYSQGEISHGSNLVGMGLLALGTGAIFFSDNTLRRKFTLGSIYFFVGLGYTSAAICKLVGTGLHWSDGRHLWLWMGERQIDVLSATGTFEFNWIQDLILSHAIIGSMVLTFGFLVELCGVLTWFKRTRYYIFPLLVCMHIGVAVSMNIFFAEYTYQLLLVGLPWAPMIDRGLARLNISKHVHLDRWRTLAT